MAPDRAIRRGAPERARRSGARLTGRHYPAEIDRRSDIARYLPPHRFPADRDALLGCLEGTDAPDEVADAIAALPADRSFATVGDVARALGIPTEH
jgi:hypothetical protein